MSQSVSSHVGTSEANGLSAARSQAALPVADPASPVHRRPIQVDQQLDHIQPRLLQVQLRPLIVNHLPGPEAVAAHEGAGPAVAADGDQHTPPGAIMRPDPFRSPPPAPRRQPQNLHRVPLEQRRALNLLPALNDAVVISPPGTPERSATRTNPFPSPSPEPKRSATQPRDFFR